jgi:F0F1-type ATP synthase epsilon subunit
MELHIITPEKSETFSIVWLEVQTPVGNFVIQKGHTPMVLPLSPNKPVAYQLTSGKKESLQAAHGMLEVNRNTATLLLRS